jgi:hypothetical protein
MDEKCVEYGLGLDCRNVFLPFPFFSRFAFAFPFRSFEAYEGHPPLSNAHHKYITN